MFPRGLTQSLTRESEPSRRARLQLEVLENRNLLATLVGLSTGNQLVHFDSAAPGVVQHQVAISGVTAGEDIVSIDARPANGLIYALSDASSLYTVNPFTGVAALVGMSGTPLNSNLAAIDFNPSVDRLRVVTSNEQNIRLNPNNGPWPAPTPTWPTMPGMPTPEPIPPSQALPTTAISREPRSPRSTASTPT
jgi:hypothetical protein